LVKRLKTWLLATALVAAPLLAGLWFNQTHLGWLNESIPDANAYASDWQQTLDAQSQLDHPAVIHWLPNTCLCRLLTLPHALQISTEAATNGFSIYQFNADDRGLGAVISAALNSRLGASPTIFITNSNGQISYLGAYSEGIRCSRGNSLVATFIDDPLRLPNQRVVGLDVETCRCLPK
jgi:hypothetical protein